MTFKAGDRKPEGSGIRKGGQHKKTVIRREVIESLEQEDFDPGMEWVRAIRAGDLALASAILDAWSYLYAKKGPKAEGAQVAAVDDPLTPEQIRGLVKIARGGT